MQERVICAQQPTLLPILLRSGIVIGTEGLLLWFLLRLFVDFEPSKHARILSEFDTMLLGFVFLGVVIALFLWGLLALFTLVRIAWLLLSRSATDYVLTNRRVIVRWGILRKRRRSFPLAHIQDVSCTQGILGGLFNYGDVCIQSASSHGLVRLADLKRPESFSERLLHVAHSGDLQEPLPSPW